MTTVGHLGGGLSDSCSVCTAICILESLAPLDNTHGKFIKFCETPAACGWATLGNLGGLSSICDGWHVGATPVSL